MTQEALKMALELLESAHVATDLVWKRHDAVNAIKEALAQPKKEPIAYINVEKRTLEFAKQIFWHTPTVANLDRIPLYTQRTWQGLTDEEITGLHHEIKVRLMGTYKTEDIYRAIEAKLKEKNSA